MIPSVLEDALGFNIYRVGLLFRRELIRALAEYKMTPEQWQIMITLWSTGKPLNQTEIVQDTLKDKHTVSRIIHRLERDGWINRTYSPRDRRVMVIQLTGKAISLKDEVPQRLSGHFKKVLKNFSKDERRILLKLLRKLRGILGDSLPSYI